MKTRHLLLVALGAMLLSTSTFAQNGVGIGTDAPNNKAILHMKSYDKGLLIPRMTTAQRNAIAPGASEEGLTVYDTDLSAYMVYNGSQWENIGEGASRWSKNGTSIYYNDGNVGIGTASPLYKLQVYNADRNVSGYFRSDYDGPSAKYGIYNWLTDDGTGAKYAIYNTMTANSTDNSTTYGIRNAVNTNNSPAAIYGSYNSVSSGGTGTHYGVYSTAGGAGNYAFYGNNTDAAGWAGYFNGRTSVIGRLGVGTASPSYKLHVANSNESIAGYFYNNNTSNSTLYGLYSNITSAGTGTQYGLYSFVSSSGTGTHYGVYSYAYGDGNRAVYGSNSHSNGWAGYFAGRGYFSSDVEISSKIKLQPFGYASSGEIEMFDNDGTKTIAIQANETTTTGSQILMYNEAGQVAIELDAEYGSTGASGRIITDELQIKGGSDLAEHFDILPTEAESEIAPGMLVSIDPASTGKLVVSESSYDHRLAGIVSGANGVNPGMLMGQDDSIADGEYPVALSGRVYVYADAQYGAILPGDLLTSSETPGHAMKAKNKKKAQGAVIGKAMTELKEGTGFVLVLVNLQ